MLIAIMLWPGAGDRVFYLGHERDFAPGTVTSFHIDDGLTRWKPPGSGASLPVTMVLVMKQARPVFHVVRLPSGQLLILDAYDPHLGCLVPWRHDFDYEGTRGVFRNPCHGETYAMDGRRLFDPAPRNLDRYEVAIDLDGWVSVDLDTWHRDPRAAGIIATHDATTPRPIATVTPIRTPES